jgi:hypothetical protein
MVEAEDVFKAADFRSMKFVVTFQNITTRTEILDSPTIGIIETADKSITLEMPKKTCNIKHSVMILIKKVDYEANKLAEVFGATGRVLGTENVSEEFDKVTIALIQFEEKSWNDFRGLMSSRQEEINRFFASVKGY